MVLSLFQSLAILVVLHVYALAEPQTYVKYRHYNGVLTLPPKHPENFNTVSPAITQKPTQKPSQKNSEGDTDNKSSKDTRTNMNAPSLDKNSPPTTPAISIPANDTISPLMSKSNQSGDSVHSNPSNEPANSDAKDSKSRLAPSSRRVKKISMTGAPPSKSEEPVPRQRAMTLPR